MIDQTVCLENGNWPAGLNKKEGKEWIKISMERINPRLSGGDSSNWADNNPQIARNGIDAKENPINGTPRAQNSLYQSLPPNAITDLTIDLQNSYSNKAVLTWSTSTDPDTLSENLYYFIYYSKTEADLTATSTTHATTTTTTITISDLDYNSTYYFGIKAFDPQNNFSGLATTSPYKTATLGVIASDFPPNLTIANNGRKIARTSNNDLYVVYSKDGKILLAKSENNGIDWNSVLVSEEGVIDQINPSIAVDSQNTLHIVWQGKVGTSTVYQIRYRKYDGSSWSDIKDLTNNSEWNQEIPVVAIDSQNNVHIVWVNNQKLCSTHEGWWAPKILYQLYQASTGQWEAATSTGSSQGSSIFSLTLAIDSQDNLHLVWQGTITSGPSWSYVTKYRKRSVSGWIEEELPSGEQVGDFPSLAIDNQDNLHFVWHSVSGYDQEGHRHFDVNYLKLEYIPSTNSWATTTIKVLERDDRYGYVITSPSIAVNSRDNLYVIWKRRNADKISLIEYTDSWQEIKTLDSLVSRDRFGFTNLLWSLHPTRTNQPQTGFAFIFYEGTELKFYASQDLTWE